MSKKQRIRLIFVLVYVGSLAAAFAITALLMNIQQRKAEAATPFVRVVEVTEDTTDPAVWGRNWPRQYDQYQRTALSTGTRFGGHGGSESLPPQKADVYPWLTTIYQGYAFALDYRERRGHAYMLVDQEQTERHSVPQSGSCLHCHASVMPVYRELGNGDAMAGFKASHQLSYQEINSQLHEMGHAHPVSCVDCHDPDTMHLRVTRPGFILGIQALAESDAETPHLPSIDLWRKGDREVAYNPNQDATRNEMRSFVCGQCHVEYYCGDKMPLTFPWGKGLTVENLEDFWKEEEFPDGEEFYDYVHKLTGAKIFKAQHPEFEVWSQGIHARAGVSCSDCHMPYMRDGATKISDHWVRSPLLNVNRACQVCHSVSEDELLARVDGIQERNYELLQNAGEAVEDLIYAIVKAGEEGATDKQLELARQLQQQSQWYLDFISSENSMGFHAPQETARILGNAANLARQGQVKAIQWEEEKE
ncbi:MAG: ammonia-forming cytochrome c nitrite reductase subunit c552 [Kiritimatiellae bacterium]|jgi:nitrite reductase (cytochrome c-552)|nr:ammonia-forming cytochrome c nitrite reductase subunit c552 [Kiritimatiellia bacterium]